MQTKLDPVLQNTNYHQSNARSRLNQRGKLRPNASSCTKCAGSKQPGGSTDVRTSCRKNGLDWTVAGAVLWSCWEVKRRLVRLSLLYHSKWRRDHHKTAIDCQTHGLVSDDDVSGSNNYQQ